MVSRTGRHIAVGSLAAASAYVRSGLQGQDDLTPRYLEAVENGWAAMEDADISTQNLRMLLTCFVPPIKAFDEGRNLAGMERASAGVLKMLRLQSARDPESPMVRSNLGGSMMIAGRSALANGNHEPGLALLAESIDVARATSAMVEPMLRPACTAHMEAPYGYVEAARSLPDQYADQALAWAHEAKRIYDQNLPAWSQESRWKQTIQDLDAFFAECGIGGAVD